MYISRGQAVGIIKNNLKMLKFVFDDEFGLYDIVTKDIKIRIDYIENSWSPSRLNYSKVKITVEPINYDFINNKYFRRGLNDFNVVEGDYSKLVKKIKETEKVNCEITIRRKEREDIMSKNYEEVVKKITNANIEIDKVRNEHVKIKHPLLDITVLVQEKGNKVRLSWKGGDVDDLIKFLNNS